MKRLLPLLAAALGLWALLGGPPGDPGTARAADREAEAEADLARIREQIKAVERRVRADTARRSRLNRDLRSAEESAAKARRALADLRKELGAARQERDRLNRELEQARRDLETQRAALAAQLRLAHRQGQGARLQAMLSQTDPAALSRRLQYLAYLARSRQATLQAVQSSLVALEAARVEVEAQEAALARLEAEQSREVVGLDQARKERATVLAKANQQVKGNDARLRQLRSEAAGLERLIRDLERAIAREAPRGRKTPADDGRPLPGGRWPVVGRLLADYGQARAGGQMRWEGVLIGAPAGTEVRATRNGRVVYADWLPGLGLLMVLDHGQGILSLYGHNQELARAVGDRVAAGDTIARVGDTGGQGRPALYFEVRRNGKPQNPHRWVR